MTRPNDATPTSQQIGYVPSIPSQGHDAQLLLALLQNEATTRDRRDPVAALEALAGSAYASTQPMMGSMLSRNPMLGTNLSPSGVNNAHLLALLANRSLHPNTALPKSTDGVPTDGLAGHLSMLGTMMGGQARAPMDASFVSHAVSEKSESDTEDINPVVRKEQVEAALRSKPQRGRKRANLTALERQELIRNRNREHAKETRIRKKMRHEQLEEKERQLEVQLEKEKLQQARRQAVIQYVESRQKMLQSMADRLDGGVSNDEDPKDGIADDPLCDLIHDIATFQFNAGDLNIAHDAQGCASLERLRSYDLDLAAKIEAHSGKSALASVQYVVRQGVKSVSLDCNGGGMVEVDVVLSTKPQVLLQRGFLRFQFAGEESSKLGSIHWWISQDILGVEDKKLSAQTSHQSMVSMDSSAGKFTATPHDSEITNGSGKVNK